MKRLLAIGLIVAAAVLLGAVGPVLADEPQGECRCAFGNFEAPLNNEFAGQDVCQYTAGNGGRPLVRYAAFFANVLIALTVAAGIVMVVLGGYTYMTAGGSAERIGKAKSFIGMALLGIALALSAFIILDTVSPQFASNVEEPQLSVDDDGGGGGGGGPGAACSQSMPCTSRGYYCHYSVN